MRNFFLVVTLACIAYLSPAHAQLGTIRFSGAAVSTGNFPDISSAADLNFQANVAFGCSTVATCVVPTNNGKYTQAANNTWALAASNTLPWSDLGIFPEHATTSAFTSTRDLTAAAWTKNANMSAANTAVGICPSCGSNLATTLTATGPNATVCRTASATAVNTATAFIRRRTGTGEIDFSVDNLVTPNKVDQTGYALMNVQRDLDTDYQPIQLVAYANNPTVCIRIVTSGDAIDVDYLDLQSQSQFSQAYANNWTSPVPTGGTTRNQDVYTAASTLLTTLRGSAFTVVMYVSGMTNAQSLNVYNGPNNVSPDKGATNVSMIVDDTNLNYIFQTGGSGGANVTVNNSSVVSGSGFGPLFPGNDFNNPSFPVETNAGVGGWQAPSILCFSSDGSGSSFTFSGGTVVTGPSISFSTTVTLFRNVGAFVTRLTVYNTRKSDAAMKAQCNVQPTRPTLVDQAVAGAQYYTDYATGGEQPIPLQSSVTMGAETGQIGAPGGVTGTWNYLRGYTDTQMARFGIIPGSPPGLGISSPTVTERIEANGDFISAPVHVPAGQSYTVGDVLWNSYSLLVNPAGPFLSKDFVVLSQIHDTSIPGTSLLAAIGPQGKPQTFKFESNQTGTSYGAQHQLRSACWYNVVQMMDLQSTAIGEWKVNWQGALDFDQTGIITADRGDIQSFTGAIVGTVLTVSGCTNCGNPGGRALAVGDTIKGTTVASGTKITSFGTGTGTNGTYNITPSQTVTSRAMTGGDPYKIHTKMGIYRAVSSELQTIFYANFKTCSAGADCTSKYGTSDLSGKVASPDAIPAGYTYSSAPMCPLGFLLKRDIDPAANDNEPMFLEKAA